MVSDDEQLPSWLLVNDNSVADAINATTGSASGCASSVVSPHASLSGKASDERLPTPTTPDATVPVIRSILDDRSVARVPQSISPDVTSPAAGAGSSPIAHEGLADAEGFPSSPRSAHFEGASSADNRCAHPATVIQPPSMSHILATSPDLDALRSLFKERA